jgi:hypothetical protein
MAGEWTALKAPGAPDPRLAEGPGTVAETPPAQAKDAA